MKPIAAAFFILLLVAGVARGIDEQTLRTELPKGAWYLFQDKSDFPQPFSDAAAAVLAAIKKEGLPPNHFFVQLEYGYPKNLILFHLWDLGMFPLDHNIKGDPTHKCRTVEYDLERKIVLKIYGWK